jgi:hypothetical protein
MDPIAIGLIAVGVVLLLFGASLSVYGVALLGLLIGGGGGYMLSAPVGSLLGLEGTIATAASVGLLALVGAFLAYTTLSIAVAGIGFVAAGFITNLTIIPLLDITGAWYVTLGVTFVGAFVGAWMGILLTKTTLIVTTSFFGAALASQSLTMETFDTVVDDQKIDPLLFDGLEPVFLGLFVLGVLTQFGLFKFGYVTKIVGILPGAGMVTNDRDPS